MKKALKIVSLILLSPILLLMTVVGLFSHWVIWVTDPTYCHKAAMEYFYPVINIVKGVFK